MYSVKYFEGNMFFIEVIVVNVHFDVHLRCPQYQADRIKVSASGFVLFIIRMLTTFYVLPWNLIRFIFPNPTKQTDGEMEKKINKYHKTKLG